jgi:hypothetical protein
MARTRIALFLLLFLIAALRSTFALPVTCTISGQVLNVDGTPAANATISFNPVTPQPLTTGGTQYTSNPISTQTDANGNMAPVALPQGLMVQVTIYQNGASQGGWTAIVPFISAVSFVQMNQGINTQPLDVLTSAQPPTGPVNLNGQRLTNVGCSQNSGDALVQGCTTSIGPLAITGDIDFQGFSLLQGGGLTLVQQPPIGSVTVSATCSGTCATTYTYDITCVTSTGETNQPVPATAVNASSLSVSNFNTITWPSQNCTQGYNVYGRIAGSLGLLANVPQGTTTYTDTGATSPGDSYTFNWAGTGVPALSIWDLRGINTQTPLDAVQENGGVTSSGTLTATSITTSATNDTLLTAYGIQPVVTFPAFPAGYSNVLIWQTVANVNLGLAAGLKNVPTAGATGNVSITFSPPPTNLPWTALNIGLLASNPATPATVVAAQKITINSPYNTVTFGDPPGTLAGDVLVVCVSYHSAATLTVPSSFNLLGAVAPGGIGTFVTRCYWTLPNGTTPVPVVNTTGGISQTTASGGTVGEWAPGLISFTGEVDQPNFPSPGPFQSVTYPVSMKVLGCRASYVNMVCSSGYPTPAMRDATGGGVVLCSKATGTGGFDGVVTPNYFTLPANDLLTFVNSNPVTCTGGTVSMTITMEQTNIQ